MKFENVGVYNFENAIRGMRNPLESWAKSDSIYGFEVNNPVAINALTNGKPYCITRECGSLVEFVSLGDKDIDLAKRLIAGGAEHRKFLRQIFVSVDITAPLYW